MAKKKFTDKESAFIEQYLLCLNGAESARRAGYSHDTARNIATENLSKPHIYEEIERRRKKMREKAQVELDEIVSEVKALAFAELGNLCRWDENGVVIFNSDEVDARFRKAVKKIKKTQTKFGTDIEVEIDDKSKNLKLLAELLGYLSDKPPGDDGPHSPTVTELLIRVRENKKQR